MPQSSQDLSRERAPAQAESHHARVDKRVEFELGRIKEDDWLDDSQAMDHHYKYSESTFEIQDQKGKREHVGLGTALRTSLKAARRGEPNRRPRAGGLSLFSGTTLRVVDIHAGYTLCVHIFLP